MSKRRRRSRQRMQERSAAAAGGAPTSAAPIQTIQVIPDPGGEASAPPAPPVVRRLSWPGAPAIPLRWGRIASWTGVVVVLVLLFFLLRPMLTTLALALGVAYLLSPLVDAMERRGLRRWMSILVLMITFFGAVTLAIVLLVPLVQHEVSDLLDNVPAYYDRASLSLDHDVRPWLLKHAGYRLPTSTKAFWQENGQRISGMVPDLAGQSVAIIKTTLGNVLGLIGILLNIVLFPIFVFYMLNDFNRIKAAAMDAIPHRYRGQLEIRLVEVDRVIATFIRGQLTLAVILSIYYSIGLSLIGIDLAIVIGVAAGACFVIPFAGYAIGITAACTMSIVKFGFDLRLLWIVLMFATAALLESNVVTPKIVGERVGLHPVVMITAVIVGGELFGFLGVLLAVPLTAGSAVFYRALWVRYRASEFFLSRQ